MNPPNPPGYISNKDSMGGFGQLFPKGATYFPPLDLVYLASYLEAGGVPLETLECLGLELTREQAAARVQAAAAAHPGERVLLVARTSAPTLDWDLSVCEHIKAAAPGVDVGIYGAIVPHVVKRIQQEVALDYIIRGEPDETVRALAAGEPLAEVDGIIYRDGAAWAANPERGFNKKLDELPFPRWELFPYEKYTLPKSSDRAEVAFLPMLTSRGCPVGCHYCPYPIGQGALWRRRSAENVVDEIEHLVRDLGVEYILFRDPIFTINQKRVRQICEEILRRDLRFEWRCETRIDCLSEETLRLMADAGCSGLNFGIESAEVEIQQNVGRKPITQEQFIETIGMCRRLGIKTFGFFIIGLPGDTVDTILNSIKFAIDMRTNWVQFTVAAPFIGTKLRDWAITQGFATEDEYAYVNSYSAAMGNENLTIEQVQDLAKFARFIGSYLINRRFLKRENAPSAGYRLAKRLVDDVTAKTAHAVFEVGKWHFKRQSERVPAAAAVPA